MQKTKRHKLFFTARNLIAQGEVCRILFSIVILLLCNTETLKAQHYQFSQFYSARTYLNPAFAGVDACSKLSLTYRDQWASVPGAFVTTQVGFDQAIRRNNGIGFLLFSDKSGYGGLSSTMFSGLYSYEININRKTRLRFGVAAGGVSRKIDYTALLFGDQIERGGSIPTIENPTQASTYLDFSSGAICYSSKSWLGASGIHLTQPNQSLLIDETSKLPFELRVHGGRRFYNIKKKKTWDSQYLTMAFNYKMQLEFDQLDIGVYLTKSPMNFGVWYRGLPLIKTYKSGYSNHDAIVLLAGFSWDRFTVGYSYDITISKLTNESGGSHEISISYNFCNNKKKRTKSIVISCPKF